MRAGQLHEQVIIQYKAANSPSKNSIGEDDYTWTAFHTCRARIRSLSGNEQLVAQTIESKVDSEILIRYFAGITADMRVLWGAVYFDIAWVDNVMEANKEIKIMCSRGASLG